jgi:hypothetical protein
MLTIIVGSSASGAAADAVPAENVTHAADTAHHDMHDMTRLSASDDISTDHDPHGQHADCAMTMCCFSDPAEPRLDLNAVAVATRYLRIPPEPAIQADPNRADKPPRRT